MPRASDATDPYREGDGLLLNRWPTVRARAARWQGSAAGRIGGADTGGVTTERAHERWSTGPVLGAAVAIALSALAFVVLDVVIAVAVAVVFLTVLGMGLAARGWDQHSTFEEREQERALRRKKKWEQNADARERDRRRWEAHQAQQNGSTGSGDGGR